MRANDSALALVRGLARTAEGGQAATADAEARLREVLAAVTALDVEVERLSGALDDFSRRYERALAEAFADLGAAERLVRRIQALEDALVSLAERLRSGAPAPAQGTRRGAGARERRRRAATAYEEAPAAHGAGAQPGGEDEGEHDDDRRAEAAQEPPALERADLALKRIHRRLARLLHPDLAQDDGERARLGELMARVNAAYGDGDLTALEVMAERLGAGEPLGELSPDERRAHLERRISTLERIAGSLGRERDRLLATDTHRLAREGAERGVAGRDLIEETRAELHDEAEAAYADALVRLGRLGKAARELSRARNAAMTKIVKRGPSGAQRAFDPLSENELVRMGAARLERRRATAAARALARRLEETVATAPWEAALTLLAFFAEDAAGRPPDALARPEGWRDRWETLRVRWPAAPDLPRLLARLPRHLVLGARTQGDELVAGVQLAEAELLAGVRIALERDAFASLAREVLAVLGPDEACACGARAPALHVLRTRGLDERHGLACPRCGAILRSYWKYGAVDGLEALAPHALRLGLVAEATAQLAGTTIGFQMLPAERERLTAERLCGRFCDLYLTPYEVALPREALRLVSGKGPLAPGAPLGGAKVRFTVDPSAPTTDDELLELLRVRIERRFRP
jgi:hypothetical protein